MEMGRVETSIIIGTVTATSNTPGYTLIAQQQTNVFTIAIMWKAKEYNIEYANTFHWFLKKCIES